MDTTMDAPARKSAEERKAILSQNVAMAVARGGRIQSQADYQAVLLYGKPVNHVLHLIITVLTLGLWVVIWLPLVVIGGEKRQMISVDEFGSVAVQDLGKQ